MSKARHGSPDARVPGHWLRMVAIVLALLAAVGLSRLVSATRAYLEQHRAPTAVEAPTRLAHSEQG